MGEPDSLTLAAPLSEVLARVQDRQKAEMHKFNRP